MADDSSSKNRAHLRRTDTDKSGAFWEEASASRRLFLELRNHPTEKLQLKRQVDMKKLRPAARRKSVALHLQNSLWRVLLLSLVCCAPIWAFTVNTSTKPALFNIGLRLKWGSRWSFSSRVSARRRNEGAVIAVHPLPRTSYSVFIASMLPVSSTEASETEKPPPPLSSELNMNGRSTITDLGVSLSPIPVQVTPTRMDMDTSTSTRTSTLSSYSSSLPTSTSTATPSLQGLSKFHLSILSRTADRQRFITGRYPVTVTVKDNPTRKWLNLGRRTAEAIAETEIFVNGTAASRSLASLDRFLWLDDSERQHQQEQYAMVSLELLAEIHLERPGYLQILDSRGAGARAAASHAAASLQADHHHPGGGGGGWRLRTHTLKLLKRIEGHNNAVVSSARTAYHESITTNIDRLWVTGFSLAGRQGLVTAVDCETCYIKPVNDRSRNAMLWPNEVQQVPADLLGSYPTAAVAAAAAKKQKQRDSNGLDRDRDEPRRYQDALLVCDGFLVPTKDRGGLYVVKNPGHETEWTVCLTKQRDRWFYHRAVWIDLTGDGRRSILTARCKVSTVLDSKSGDGIVTSGITKTGELVWLECPKPASIDPETGTPLEADGTVFDPFSTRHMPWKTRVLATGPDVMFCVADLDTEDDSIEVISSEFFKKRVTMHSIRRGPKPKVKFIKTIDDHCGRAFGCILADLDTRDAHTDRCVVDSGSTVECLAAGDSFSHVLVTSHECSYVAESSADVDASAVSDGVKDVKDLNLNGNSTEKPYAVGSSSPYSPEGGSLFAYRVPEGKDAWKTEPWKRTIVASGFKVNGKLKNMINPGAPGFLYTFHAKKDDVRRSKRPMIAVAGDCAESAYIFRPESSDYLCENSGDITTNYKLMVEIQCEATVGSIGIGYDDFSSGEQESGFAKLYIPCYEKDKILVFGLGSGEDDTTGW